MSKQHVWVVQGQNRSTGNWMALTAFVYRSAALAQVQSFKKGATLPAKFRVVRYVPASK